MPTTKETWKSYTLPKQISMLAAAFMGLLAVAGATWAGYSHLRTEPEAAITAVFNFQERAVIAAIHITDKITAQEARKNDRIDRLEREIARYERDLLDPKLPQPERDFIERQIGISLDKIKCIREETC